MKFKAEIDNEGIKITTSGTVPELCAAINAITNEEYTNLVDETAKGAFKFALQKAFSEGLPFMNGKDLAEQAAKSMKEMKKAKEEKEDSIIPEGELREFLKGLLGDD